LKRFDPLPRVWTTSTVHLSPIRDSRVLIVRHTGLIGSLIIQTPVKAVFPHHKHVRCPQKSAFLQAIRTWLFGVPE
jgi:hypothetical protein